MGIVGCLCEVIEANVIEEFPMLHYVVGEGSRQHVRQTMRLGFRNRSGNAVHCFVFLVMLPLDRLVYTQVCNLSDCSPS